MNEEEKTTKDDTPPVDPNLRFRVQFNWQHGHDEVLPAVTGYSLEDEVYFIYQEPEAGVPMSKVRTVWVKHPNLLGVEIMPYIKES